METPKVNYTIKFTQEYGIGRIEYSSVRYQPQYLPPTITFYPEPIITDRAEDHRVA